MYKYNVLSAFLAEEKEVEVRVESCALSERGPNKPMNEDFVFHRSTQMPGGQAIGLLVVCDGMGGQLGGFASELATHVVTHELDKVFPHREFLRDQVEQPNIPRASRLRSWILETIQEANRLIFEYAAHEPAYVHSGTRLTLAFLQGHTAHIAHVGDTRAYLWRNLELSQITQDHSIAAELEKGGVLEPAEVLHHPLRKVMSRSVGTQPAVEPELYSLSLWPGDKLLLCSDGVWAAFEQAQDLADLLDNTLPAEALCAKILDETRLRNQEDDVSVALACLEDV